MKSTHSKSLVFNAFNCLILAALLQTLSCSPQEKTASVWPSCQFEERNAEILWPEGIKEWEYGWGKAPCLRTARKETSPFGQVG
jgi:hypothetical protein